MVYTSLPVYLDPPNWNQQQHQHQQSHQAGGSGGGGTGGIITGGGGANTSDLQQSLAPPRPEGGGVVGTAARPGSMADRARLAKLPQPEPALKCPRCDSTNTKFCYYNNYSLSQPRHFCKTCRRYWTRGGALRNVPVGGGCRRNKRSKSATSKTLANEGKGPGTASAMGAALAAAAASGGVGGTIGSSLSALPQLPFLSSLHPFPDYRSASAGLNYGGIQTMDHVEYEVGSSSGSGLEQWRLQQVQQFPFFTGLETAQPSISLYPFNGTEGGGIDATATMFTGQLQGKPTCAGLINQLASVKMEENGHGLILPRQYLGIPANDQYWSSAGGGGSGATTAAARAGGGDSSTSGGATWTDLSGFHSSSTGNLL